jgi:hypothetical protein
MAATTARIAKNKRLLIITKERVTAQPKATVRKSARKVSRRRGRARWGFILVLRLVDSIVIGPIAGETCF